MALIMHQWQEQDVTAWADALLSGKTSAVFCAYEQSLGKTLVSVELIKRLKARRVIIVAPLNTRASWQKAVEEQEVGLPVYRLSPEKEHVVNFTKLANHEEGIFIVGWELMRRGSIEGAEADLVIADETHRQQNRGSDSHNGLKGIKGTYRLALSGTPAGNQPDGIFATIHWLWPDRYRSHQAWVDRFWRVIRNGAVVEFVREQTPGGVLADLPMFTRRLRKDHRDDMPAVLPEIVIDVDMTPGQWKIYNQFKEVSGAWVGDEFIPAALPLVEDLRLGQVTLGVPTVDEAGTVTFALDCKSSKIDMLVDVLRGQPKDSTMLVMVPSARFIPSVVHQLNKKGFSAAGLSGELTPPGAAREKVLADFGSEFRVLVAGIAAIAEGTDGLQYKCSRQFWMDKHPNNMLNQQGRWRLDRPGQTEPVQSWFTKAVGTINERRVERLEEINATLTDFIDAPRGIDIE